MQNNFLREVVMLNNTMEMYKCMCLSLTIKEIILKSQNYMDAVCIIHFFSSSGTAGTEVRTAQPLC